jgi:hypothetical protein
MSDYNALNHTTWDCKLVPAKAGISCRIYSEVSQEGIIRSSETAVDSRLTGFSGTEGVQDRGGAYDGGSCSFPFLQNMRSLR